jgi:vacuolar-type H+-ATPase subunit I/STV1
MLENQEKSEVVETQTESATVENEQSTQENDAEIVEKRTVPEDRFKQVYAQKKQQERKIAELEQQLQNNQAPIKQDTKAPSLEDFDYDQEKFNAASVDYQVEQQFKKRDKQASEQKQQKKQNDLLSAFDKKEAAYHAENEDYQKAIDEVGNVGYNETINNVLLNSENGAKLDHYLLRHPEEIQNLSSMNPIQQTMYLGKLEGELTKQKSIKQSKAPEPIETVKGTTHIKSDGLKNIGGATFE